ncbi:GNAT family N-acetyltransferase [Rhizobium sp. FKL33]|uniref:GNAT family N-acetyltransferase n=1 Tax=Rhizobium sp. FKL33 TaxID=2562307 RepID=UPI0010C03EB4|nr:GNAT family N-acetyltransferase [Rhizobium sp. FKL33]
MFFVRTASEGDLKAVSALLGRSWHATYDALYGADKVSEITASWHSVAALTARLKRPDSEFVVADDGKTIGGVAYAAMAEGESDVAILHMIYVEPGLTGQGIGRDLFAEVETCFPSARRMRLEVEPKNERAVAFYTGLGFAEVGWTKNCGAQNSGIPALILEKTLSF